MVQKDQEKSRSEFELEMISRDYDSSQCTYGVGMYDRD